MSASAPTEATSPPRPVPLALPGPTGAVPGYEVLGELGRGGMGVVYKARQVALNRVVALKMILAGAHAAEQDRARFRAEAEAIARLQHPGIVQVHEVGQHDGCPFFSLDYCPGGTLAERLAGKPLPPRDAAALVEALARAVHYAHDHGVVHRDLKPSNVLLAADGSPRITDFGLAKTLDAGSGHTRTGSVLGTPSYMAPEQAAGKTKELGPLVDVYALGALLYECITGRPPFQGPTPLDTIAQVLHDEPAAPRSLQPGVPRDLETVCLRCLEKEPARRYASAQALADDLRRYLDGEPVAARPAGALERAVKWARRRPGVAALLAALTLISLGAFAAVTAALVLAEGRRREAEGKQQELTHTVGALELARAEADRARVQAESEGYFSNVALASQLLRANDVAAARRALDRCRPDYRRWEWLHLSGQCRAARAAAVVEAPVVVQLVPSPDGKTLAALSMDGGLLLLDAATGAPRLRFRGPLIQGSDLGPAPAFSPSGRELAAVDGRDDTVCVFDAATGQERCRLAAPGLRPLGVAFRPDGTLLAAGCARPGEKAEERAPVTVDVWDLTRGRRVAALAGLELPKEAAELRPPPLTLAFAPGGDRLAAWAYGLNALRAGGQLRGPDFDKELTRVARLFVWDVPSAKLIRKFDTCPEPPLHQCAFSPDGRRLAWAAEGVLWESDLSGGQPAILRGHSADVYGVAYSPDGGTLASAGADRAIKVWGVAGRAELFTLRGHDLPAMRVAFAPDGARLWSCGGDWFVKSSEWRAWAVEPTEVRTWRALDGAMTFAFALAPTAGHFAVFNLTRRPGDVDRISVAVHDLATGKRLCELADEGRGVTPLGAFSPDGKRLAVLDRVGITLYDAAGGKRLAVLPVESGAMRDLPAVAFAPDGRLVLAGFQEREPGRKNAPRRLRLRLTAPSPEAGRFAVDVAHDVFADASVGDDDEMVLVGGVAVRPDGGRLALAVSLLRRDRHKEEWLFRGELLLCDGSGRLLARRGVEEMLLGVAFAPDGSRLAVGGGTNTAGRLLVFAADDAARLLDLRCHSRSVEGVAFSPDNSRVVTASSDRTVKLWDAASGREALTLTGNHRAPTVTAFAPDGRLLTASGVTVLSMIAGPLLNQDLRAPAEVKAWAAGP
jgi:WD40 repeat protein